MKKCSILIAIIILLLIGCLNDNHIIAPVAEWEELVEEEFNYDALEKGKLSFVRNGKVYLLDAKTKTGKVLAEGFIGSEFSHAAMSPNGEQIALNNYRIEWTYKEKIFLIGTEKGEFRQISSPDHNAFSRLSWSINNDEIFYEGGPDYYSDNLYSQSTINESHPNLIRLFEPGQLGWPVSMSVHGIFCFSPIVQDDLHSDIPQLDMGIYSMDLDGENLEIISKGGSELSYVSPQYSPDGNQIAYMTLNGDWYYFDSQDIGIMDKNGSNKKILARIDIHAGQSMKAPSSFRGLSLSWSSDGTKLAFTKLEGDLTWHIYTIDILSGKMEQVTFGEKVRDYSVSWSQ